MRITSDRNWCASALLALATLPMGVAQAQVPANLETELRKIGRIVDPPCTAKLYRPLMPANDVTSSATPLYPGIAIARDLSFGPHPKDVVDVFTAEKGGDARPVLIYVPGGAGDKIELQNKESNAFYDNIARWATKNGMVGVTMQRHFSPGWDDGAKDVARMIQWLQANIAKYRGNPDRMFIWAHSAGNMPLGTYIGRPELHGPKGVGVKGVIFMSPAPFNIAPLDPGMGVNPTELMALMTAAGKTCGAGGLMSTDGALPGRAPGQPGGPAARGEGPFGPPAGGSGARAGGPPGTPGGAPPGFGPPVDPATQLTRSSLPVLKKTTAKIMLANAELDLGADVAANGGMGPFNKALRDELCQDGAARCPTLLYAKGHSHMSIVFSIDTPDTSVSGPILDWMKRIQ